MITEVQYAAALAEIDRLKARIRALEALNRMCRAERFIPLDTAQLNLFAEVDEDIEIATVDADHPEHSRTHHPGRQPLPEHFPLEIEYVVPTDVKVTQSINSEDDLQRDGYQLLGYETSERVDYRPAQYVRILQKRPKYRNLATGEYTVAHARDRVLARSIADETLGVDVVLKKFCDHLPLYRQAEALKRDHDWALRPATMGRWVDKIAVALRPLYDTLVEQVTASGYVQMDESRIRVLSADTPGATHQGWMWLVRDPETGAVAFHYDKGRSSKVPSTVLSSFNGILQTDGYGAYARALKGLRASGAQLTHVGCLAHIRRKFFDAQDANPEPAAQALSLIQRIYAGEAEWRGQPPEARKAQRATVLQPVFEEFDKWLAKYEHQVIPKTPLGKAVGYAISQWPSLRVVLDDGRVEVDNNGIENQVRPLALGRKNYLFAGNHGAAQNIAVLYSLLLTCKARGVNARHWLLHVLDEIPTLKINERKRIQRLLPTNWKPDE